MQEQTALENRIVRDTFMKFFFPTVASSITLSVISMTDLIIAGNLVGDTGLSAISLGLPIVIFAQIVYALFGMGGAIFLAVHMGRGDREYCSRIFTVSMLSSLVIGLLAAVFGTLFLGSLVRILGATDVATAGSAEAYIGVLFLGLPFLILSPVMVTYLRNDNEQKYAMFCVVTAGLSNIVFSVGLVLAFDMGCAGIAAGTVLAEALCCVLAAIKLFSKNRMFGLVKLPAGKETLRLNLNIVKFGITLAVIFASQILLTIVVNHALGRYGGIEGIAIYAVIKYLINFLFALFDGVTGSIQPMLGIYYGEKEEENVRRTAKIGAIVMFVISVTMGVLMFAFGPLLCALFHITGEVLTKETLYALRVLSIYCPLMALTTFLNAFYRCTGRTKAAFVISILDNLVFPVTLVLLLSANFQLRGVWYGLLAASAATNTCILLYCLISRKGFLMLDKKEFERAEGGFRKILPAKKENLPELLSEVEMYCDEAGIGPKQAYYITLVIEELVVNVVNMAGEHRGFDYADIMIAREGGKSRLRIRDNLTQFDPTKEVGDMEDVRSGLMDDEKEKNTVNELGIGIVKKIASEYSYRRTIGYNNFMVVL
ncbi:MAG: ATP-binding protein [Lachnospiraceae bacterium]|nr:ATP-binding protein [Lachnospiraceae bacterium]